MSAQPAPSVPATATLPAPPAPDAPFALCWRVSRTTGTCLYVSHLPGEAGADWGYTSKPEGTPALWPGSGLLDVAKPLNRHWQRRFRADCRRVGETFHSRPTAAPEKRARKGGAEK